MQDSAPTTPSPATLTAEPLSPARATLARAIERFAAASAHMEETHGALAGLERPPASLSSRDAGELRADMTRLHEITNWLGARATGQGPSLASDLKKAEAWFGEVADAAASAEERLSAAERDYTDAAHAARDAQLARDRAVWAAAVDAAGPALRRLEQSVAAVYERDACVRSLIVALREIGHRNTEENSGALTAAEKVEVALHAARHQNPRNSDPALGRSVIERLQTDPLAILEIASPGAVNPTP